MKKTLALLLAVLTMLSLCACGSSAKHYAREQAPDVSYSSQNSAAYEEGSVYPASYALADEAYEASGLSMNAKAAPTEAEAPHPEPDSAESETPDKIIYSADVTVETTDFESSINGVDSLVKQYGGWVESSSINGSNYYDTARGNPKTRSANYTLRIPSARFQELLTSLSVLGNVPYSHIYTENVTARYYDTQARLTAYTTQETRLLEMMELAESVEDVIMIEDKLTELRYQIESLQSSLNNWDRHISYSTITLKVSEVREYTPEPEVPYGYGDRMLDALRDGLDSAGEFLLLLVSMLPVLLILAVIILIIVLIILRFVRKRKARKPEKASKATEKPPVRSEKPE